MNKYDQDEDLNDPKNQNEETDQDDNEEGWDILPSNGPGLAGDDGEQTVDDYEETDLDDEEQEDENA